MLKFKSYWREFEWKFWKQMQYETAALHGAVTLLGESAAQIIFALRVNQILEFFINQ